MYVRSLRMPADIRALSRMDTGACSPTRIDVVATATGFELAEVAVSVPVRKEHAFLADVAEAVGDEVARMVAVEQGRIVGIAVTEYQRWNRRQVLNHLYVDRAYRGRGSGRALVEHIADVACGNAARHLWVETQNTNVPAIRAYQAMGFALVGLDQLLYDGEYAHETALYLAKPL